MKICSAIPIETGCSQASGGLIPHRVAPASHTRAGGSSWGWGQPFITDDPIACAKRVQKVIKLVVDATKTSHDIAVLFL